MRTSTPAFSPHPHSPNCQLLSNSIPKANEIKNKMRLV